MRKKVGVLVSGRGSNLQALLDACADPAFPAEIVLVISNIPGVFALERAEKAGVATRVISHKSFSSREAFDAAMDEALRKLGRNVRVLVKPFEFEQLEALVNEIGPRVHSAG